MKKTSLKFCCRLILFIIATHGQVAFSETHSNWNDSLSAGISYRQQGKIQLSIDLLSQAKQSATTTSDLKRAAGELGASQLQARRLDQAETSLQEAYKFFAGVERARYAIDLGNLALIRKHPNEAQPYYVEALQLASHDVDVRILAGLNLTRLIAEAERLPKLNELFQEISKVGDENLRSRLYLNLGNQARQLGTQAIELSFHSLELARTILAHQQPVDARLNCEIQDALAQLYEDQGRHQDALILTRQALSLAHALSPATAGDLVVNLEWRQGRLLKTLNQKELALAAFQRAVDQIELIRQDLPIDMEDGGSSFHKMLEPIYLGLVDLLLTQSTGQSPARQAASLRKAKDSVELIKQSEMQDYLGDRCTIDALKNGEVTRIPADTAILYPVIFEDRIEILLETRSGIVRFSTQIPSSMVRSTAQMFAEDLRDGDPGFMPRSKQLYDWLFRPFDAYATKSGIKTLVVVPDGALRLVALGALNDGKNFAIEKYAITTVTGLTMTNASPPTKQGMGFLVAGVSEPGGVVDKLNKNIVDQILRPDTPEKESSRSLSRKLSMRSFRMISATSIANTKNRNLDRSAILREALALPGVKKEVEAISHIMPGTSLLNKDFTVSDFQHEAESGSYRIMHVASHGIFGGSADTSYILAYDDLLTLDGLKNMLKSDKFRKNPIELLSLSACETAEGNDRAPLGISGAAIKARAKSVLGTLWPVEDNAARKVMEKFYQGMANNHLTKAEALRRAQVDLLHQNEFSHPLFWAPFLLIGNWL